MTGVDPSLPMGSIKGRVLNDEQIVLANASVALVGYNATASTDAEGRFFFNDVNIGDYFLLARASGYKEGRLGVTVREAETTDASFVLESAPVAVSRVETLVYKKSLNCRFLIGHPLAPNGTDATGAKRTCPLSAALGSEYAADYRQELKPSFGLVGAQYEIKWQAQSAGTQRLELNVSLHPITDWRGAFEVRGPSPQLITVKKNAFDTYRAVNPKNANYAANGGLIYFSIEASPGVTGAAVDAGFAIEQNVDAVATHFYVVEPDDYAKHRQF